MLLFTVDRSVRTPPLDPAVGNKHRIAYALTRPRARDYCTFEVHVKDCSLRALLDTGATLSLVSADLFTRLGLEERVHTQAFPTKLGVADGRWVDSQGVIYLRVVIGEAPIDVCFTVLPGLRRDMIVGMDAIMRHGLQPNFRDHTLFSWKSLQ